MLSVPGKIIKKYFFRENVLEASSQVGIRLVLGEGNLELESCTHIRECLVTCRSVKVRLTHKSALGAVLQQ